MLASLSKAHQSSLRAATILLIVVGASSIVGCSSSPPPPASPSISSPRTVPLPQSAAGDMAQWVVEAMNSNNPVDDSALSTKMSASLTSSIAPSELAQAIDTRRAYRVWSVIGVKDTSSGTDDVLYVQLWSSKLEAAIILQLAVSQGEQRMSGLHYLANGSVYFSS